MLKNPFGVRDGKVVVISDLSREHERGAKCGCRCPVCDSVLQAKMGEVRAEHFSHGSGMCDSTAVFLAGLFRLISQTIEESACFYVPSLAAAWDIPASGMSRENVARYVRIIREEDLVKHKHSRIIKQGVECTEVSTEQTNVRTAQVDAIVINTHKRKLAICVTPPSICKSYAVAPHPCLPTLVFDARDMNFFELSSESIKKKILADKKRWSWISNSKVETIYDDVYNEYVKQQNEREEARREEEARIQSIKQAAMAISHARVSSDVLCAECGKLKPSSEFFAGKSRNICAECRRSSAQPR